MMEEKKTKFVVYSDDFYGNSGRKILGHVNTLAEAQELLAHRYMQHHYDDCNKMVDEVYSHTDEELAGRDSLILYGSNCYFHEGIARVANQRDGSFGLLWTNPDVDVLSFESFFVSLHCWNGFGG